MKKTIAAFLSLVLFLLTVSLTAAGCTSSDDIRGRDVIGSKFLNSCDKIYFYGEYETSDKNDIDIICSAIGNARLEPPTEKDIMLGDGHAVLTLVSGDDEQYVGVSGEIIGFSGDADDIYINEDRSIADAAYPILDRLLEESGDLPVTTADSSPSNEIVFRDIIDSKFLDSCDKIYFY
ncbi:MAG: hypothetical protein NC228_04010, partial [[Eubacterium] siraeum]|nr:hypothetical protein [[Eubacterium] siraeum]